MLKDKLKKFLAKYEAKNEFPCLSYIYGTDRLDCYDFEVDINDLYDLGFLYEDLYDNCGEYIYTTIKRRIK